MNNTMFVVKEKNTKHAFALIENDDDKSCFEKSMPWAKIIEVDNVGSTVIRTNIGTINAITFHPKGKELNDELYMITNYPDSMQNINEAYELINKD